MKKLLLGSLSLLMFSCAIVIFQISCKKDAIAQPTSNPTGKILYLKRPVGNFDMTWETWIADYDGTNATQVVLNIPGWRINSVKLSGDGTKIFIIAADAATLTTTQSTEIFSVNIDGTNLQQVTHDNASGKSADLFDVN